MSDADPVTVAILVDGSAIADDVQISAITVAHGINAIPGATITIADGGPADADCACASTPDRHRANRCRE